MLDHAQRVQAVLDYIRGAWESTVRRTEHDAHPRLYLPSEYTTPCAIDHFQELYYWDTYYAHLGLLRDGLTRLAQSNVENMFYMVRKFGFVLNSNAVAHLNRSQPPYLSMMVRDIYDRTRDVEWLRAAWKPLRAEYDFWMTHRTTEGGLNRHLHSATEYDAIDFYRGTLTQRLGMLETDAQTMRRVAYHYLAEAESGHDFTPRFDGRCADFAPIDLNSNLYEYERNFAEFSRTLDLGEEADWRDRGAERLTRIRRACWNPGLGAFTDYDTVADAPAELPTAVSFWPLAFGLATRAEADSTRRLLHRLEGPHGVSTCADVPGASGYQWGYPNAWPPVQVMVCRGLARYGFVDDARRVARLFVDNACAQFETSGYLWEKYDSVTGLPGGAEYEPTRMLGWTAGAFVYLAEFLALR